MTDSFRHCPHLQPCFLYCKGPVVLSKEFVDFFGHGRGIQLKSEVIRKYEFRKYELGFTQMLSKRFRLKALYPLEGMLDQGIHLDQPKMEIDPTVKLWKVLTIKFKFPFLKRSRLARRGGGIQEVSAVRSENGPIFDAKVLESACDS